MPAKQPQPCRGGCGKVTLRNSVRCVACERKATKKPRKASTRKEPTMAELDAMIAEQYQTMPRPEPEDKADPRGERPYQPRIIHLSAGGRKAARTFSRRMGGKARSLDGHA